MKVNLLMKGQVFVKDIVLADSFFARLAGYQFRLRPHVEGFLFVPGNSIHTFWCFFPLDLVFLTKENEVVKIIRGMKPWRATRPYLRSNKILEVPAGMIPSELLEGDVLEVQNV
jgi:uncharacterized protein